MTEHPQDQVPQQPQQTPYSQHPMPPHNPQAPPYSGAQPSYSAVPMAPADQRTWAIVSHLSPFLGLFIGGLSFLGPLILYIVFKDRGAYVRHHSAEALNFQLTMWIGLLVSVPLLFVFFLGVFTASAILMAMLVCHILGAVAASNGQDYRYPFTIHFVS
jgi:uncharacterized protein